MKLSIVLLEISQPLRLLKHVLVDENQEISLGVWGKKMLMLL